MLCCFFFFFFGLPFPSFFFSFSLFFFLSFSFIRFSCCCCCCCWKGKRQPPVDWQQVIDYYMASGISVREVVADLLPEAYRSDEQGTAFELPEELHPAALCLTNILDILLCEPAYADRWVVVGGMMTTGTAGERKQEL